MPHDPTNDGRRPPSPTGASSRKAASYAVLVNGDAGSAQASKGELDAIEESFARLGAQAIASAVDPGDLADAMRTAWQRGVIAVVVAGGDGTVSSAAACAVAHDIVLGVLPMGTFNHFAKDLGAPTGDLDAAVAWLVGADEVAVDVGEVNGRVFVNNASIGAYPVMVTTRESIRAQRGWGKVRATAVAATRTLRHLPVQRLRITIEPSASREVDTALLFVGNGLFDRDGAEVGRRSSLEGGVLGIYLIQASRRWRLVLNAIATRVGGLDRAPSTDRISARRLVVASREATLTVAIDGEPTDVESPLEFVSRPRRLRVLRGVTAVR